MDKADRVVYSQARPNGSTGMYVVIVALLVLIAALCTYGLHAGLEAKVMVPFCVLPIILGFFLLGVIRHDDAGQLVVSTTRLYRTGAGSRVLDDVQLSRIGSMLIGKGALLVFSRESAGWQSTLFHGVKDPQALADTIAGFRPEDNPTEEYRTSPRDNHKVFWGIIGLLLVELVIQLYWVMTRNGGMQDLMEWVIIGTVFFTIISLWLLAIYRGTTVASVLCRGKNVKLQMLSRYRKLYILGEMVSYKLTGQGKHMRLWTGIAGLDGRQGHLIAGGKISPLASRLQV